MNMYQAIPASSGPSWLVVLLLALLLFSGLATAIVLLVFPKTRAIGAVLLVVGAMFVLFVAGSFLVYRARSYASASSENVTVSQYTGDGRVASRSVVNGRVTLDEERSIGAGAPKPAAKPAVGTVDAMERALVKAMAQHAKTPAAEKTEAKPPPPPSATRVPSEASVAKDEPKIPVVSAKPLASSAEESPDWVNAPDGVVGDSYQMTIVVGPWKTRQECDADLPDELHKALDHYAEMCLGEPAGTRVALPYDFLREQVVKDQWEEKIWSPGNRATMTQLHVLLRFDREVKDRILKERERGVVAGRLWIGGSGLAVLLWLLTVSYGYLRTDLATGGTYRGRLQFAAALAILGPVTVALWALVR